MSFALNLLWFISGGVIAGLFWCVAGVLCFLSIVLIPFGFACFRVAAFAFFPFGKDVIPVEMLGEKRIIGTTMMNVIWIVVLGFWLALAHAVWGIALCCTIIGIPWGIANFRICKVSFAPLGKRVVSKDLARAARERFCNTQLDKAFVGKVDSGTRALPCDERQVFDGESVRQLIVQTSNLHGSGDFVFPSSPEFNVKLSNLVGVAKDKCNVRLAEDEVIAMLDCTVFGSAKAGMAFTLSGIYAVNDWTATENSGFISWRDLVANGNIRKSAFGEVHICDSPDIGINLSACDLKPKQAVLMFNELRNLAIRGGVCA